MNNKINKYWTTITGAKIEYQSIKDDHLEHILKWIEKKANTGVTINDVAGYINDSLEYCSYQAKGKEVFEIYDYEGLLKEFKSRTKLLEKISY